MDMGTALREFKSGGRIVAEKQYVDLCLRCDGFGCDGHQKKKVGGIEVPDYDAAIACRRCNGSGYMNFVCYEREDGAVFLMPIEDPQGGA